VQPLLDYEQYLELKSKRYNRYRKEVIRQIVLDKFQVKKAVEALKAFEESHQSDELFENEGFVYLEVVLAVVPEEYSIKPVQIPLPVPIYSEQFNTRSAIFVTDPQREYKDRLQDLSVPTVAKVIGYEKLKKNYKLLKDKRSLLYSYDLFFCDWRIYNLLRKPAGKLFYERKKFPFPIDCQSVPTWKKEQFGEDYAAYLNDLNNYTYLMIGNGPV
jgi:ribosome biogenesis protein UTP30